MSPRTVAIDWDGLETALTWRLDEGGHYLDVQTGEVTVWMGRDDDVVSEDDIDTGLADGRLIAIEPLPSSVEYGWMEAFAGTIRDSHLRGQLESGLTGRGVFRRFKDVLAGWPKERERWFAFRGERVREAAREWLEENGFCVRETAAPPGQS
jgi:hypothetical protein